MVGRSGTVTVERPTDIPVEVIIADLSSLRTRVFFSFVPAMPFILNSWVSPLIYEQAVGSLGERGPSFWRWGVGMWAILYPGESSRGAKSDGVYESRTHPQCLLCSFSVYSTTRSDRPNAPASSIIIAVLSNDAVGESLSISFGSAT